jgi:uncharacterized membrane protein
VRIIKLTAAGVLNFLLGVAVAVVTFVVLVLVYSFLQAVS